MLALLRLGVNLDSGPLSVRWPRDAVPALVPHISEIPEVQYGSWEILREGKDAAILAVGTMVVEAEKAAEVLAKEGVEVTVVNCRFLKPFDEAALSRIIRDHTQLLTVEEGAVVNGFGAYLAREIETWNDGEGVHIRTLGIPDQFVVHGGRGELLREIDLDAQGITEHILEMVRKDLAPATPHVRESA